MTGRELTDRLQTIGYEIEWGNPDGRWAVNVGRFYGAQCSRKLEPAVGYWVLVSADMGSDVFYAPGHEPTADVNPTPPIYVAIVPGNDDGPAAGLPLAFRFASPADAWGMLDAMHRFHHAG